MKFVWKRVVVFNMLRRRSRVLRIRRIRFWFLFVMKMSLL